MNFLVSWLYHILALGNGKEYWYRKSFLQPDGTLRILPRESEGWIYNSDPLMVWLAYFPTLFGIVVSATWGWFWLLLGVPSVGFGLWQFVAFGYNVPPQTLLIRKFLGAPEYFMNNVVWIWSRFMEWETIPGLQVNMRGDGSSGSIFKSMMRLVVDGVDKESQVEIRFAGSILFRIDLNRPESVMRSFFDDFRGTPKEDDVTDAEDMQERCMRIFGTIVGGAIDTILQGEKWEDAVSDIKRINRLIEERLPDHLHAFPLIIEKVLMEEAFGDPVDQLKRQTTSRLDAETAKKVADAEKDKRIAQATAQATASIAEAEKNKETRLAQTAANLAAALEEQRNLLKISGEQLLALGNQTQVAAKQAEIEFASLAQRLRVIGQEPLAAAIDGLVSAEPTLRLPVYTELMKSVGTAPAVTTAINVATANKMDTLPMSSLVEAGTRAVEIFNIAKQVAAAQAAQQTPPVPPTTP